MTNEMSNAIHEIEQEVLNKYKNSIPRKAFIEAMSKVCIKVTEVYIHGTEK